VAEVVLFIFQLFLAVPMFTFYSTGPASHYQRHGHPWLSSPGRLTARLLAVSVGTQWTLGGVPGQWWSLWSFASLPEAPKKPKHALTCLNTPEHTPQNQWCLAETAEVDGSK